jgi:hypothetical protein
MKKIFNLILVGLVVIASTSCEDTDKLNFNPADLGKGAFLRTLSIDSNTFNVADIPNSSWGVTVEGDDGNNGNSMTSIDVFVKFKDNTPDNGTLTIAEVLVKTIPISEFSRGASGLLSGSVTATAPETLSALGITNIDDIDGGDTFTFRLSLNLSDGRSFSSGNIGNNITGSFFNSPFRYVAAVVCNPPAPIPGDYIFQMVDTYGDGWDGAFVRVTIDGAETEITATGTGTTETITVPSGTSTLSFVYVPGNFESEHVLTIIGPVSGNEIFNANPPSAGELVLNLCNEF